MHRRILIGIAAGIAVFTLGIGFFTLPGVSSPAWLSPDETAAAVSGIVFGRTGSFAISDPLLTAYPWLHPRSFVAVDGAMVPVGFLGMPLLAAAVSLVFGGAGLPFVTPILALLSLIPLWSVSRSWGRIGQLATIFAWLAFPTVLLYANRGMFANLPVVCLAIWAAWLVWMFRRWTAIAAAGLLTGIALLMRPIEAVWILPWVVAGYCLRDRGPNDARNRFWDIAAFSAPVLIAAAIGAVLAWKTYGSPLAVGYQLRDPSLIAASSAATDVHVSLRESWTFGFHPRNVWFNVRAYLFSFLLPWTSTSAAAAILAWRERKNRPWIALGAWTVGILCLVYGQGIYLDNVRSGAITLGNSFLRYLLPFSVVFVLAFGWFCGWLAARGRRIGAACAILCVVFLASLGLWTAYNRDEEGLNQDRLELAKYADARANALDILAPGTVVFSERSDKIFFPAFRAVSPMPSTDRLRTFLDADAAPMALYARTADDAALSKWLADGFRLEAVLEAGNETLYTVAKP